MGESNANSDIDVLINSNTIKERPQNNNPEMSIFFYGYSSSNRLSLAAV
jgi:hypothetical protein